MNKFYLAAALMLIAAAILLLLTEAEGPPVTIITRDGPEITVAQTERFAETPSFTAPETAPLTEAVTEAQLPPCDLNTADKAALMRLPGIGEELAERILALRAELGGFTSESELLRVNGIGERTLSGLRAYIYVVPPEEPDVVFPLDLNRATERELCALPGIDAELAAKIIELREKIHYFSNPRELLYIDGMSEITVSGLLDLVYAIPPDKVE